MPSINVIDKFETYLSEQIGSSIPTAQIKMHRGLQILQESSLYSLNSGGKRFRPQLCFLTAEALGMDPTKVFPWAAAIEFIHTYSLIHDDLPSMDNDEFRRGKPTSHVVYGEDMALLTGDALLTQSFGLIAESDYAGELVRSLIQLLVQCAGAEGMVGGQALDLRGEEETTIEFLEFLHRKKTGALIKACLAGVGLIAGSAKNQVSHFGALGEDLGFLFQLQDDILDQQDHREKDKNFVFLLGIEKTQKMLAERTYALKAKAKELFVNSEAILQLIDYNHTRTK